MPPMDDGDRRREIRHHLRGAYHNLCMCTMVLEGEADPAEVKRWLRFIEQAADDCIRHAAAMGDLPDEAS
jgi:hypothetical protein